MLLRNLFMKATLAACFFLIAGFTAVHIAPIAINWKTLADVTFEDKHYPEFDQYLPYPTFGSSIKALENKEVSIEGYIIPIEPERYILSQNPFASCFFCGGAGPETVLELELTSYEKTYYTDQYLHFKGILKLNITDIDKLNYILEQASEIPE